MQIRGLLRHAFNPLQSYARSKGVLVTKYPSVPFLGFPIFPIILNFLNALKNRHLVFIHVGANDGGGGDPISFLAMANPWTGVLVEPQIDVFQRLVQNYKNGIGTYFFENAAIAPAGQSEVTMFHVRPSDDEQTPYNRRADLSASIDPRVTSGATGRNASNLDTFRVPCTTLDALAAKHGLDEIDVLLIDAEGIDDKVLMTLDLSRTQPLVIQFETVHLSTKALADAVLYLREAGYKILYLHPQYDTIALHPRCLELLGVSTACC